jgi:hypothetical protein
LDLVEEDGRPRDEDDEEEDEEVSDNAEAAEKSSFFKGAVFVDLDAWLATNNALFDVG